MSSTRRTRAQTNRYEGFFNPRIYLERDKYLTRENLRALQKYRYKTEGQSILESFMNQKFWNPLTKLFNKSIFKRLSNKPNILISLAFLFSLVSSILQFIQCPLAKSCHKNSGQSPKSLEIFHKYFQIDHFKMVICSAINIFLYQTFEAIHIKLREKTTNDQKNCALTIFFKHSLDSIVVILHASLVLIAVGAGQEPVWMFFICLSYSIYYYISYWSSYITDRIHFSNYDVIEAQIMAILVCLISAYFGQKWWGYGVEIHTLFSQNVYFLPKSITVRHLFIYTPSIILLLRICRDQSRRIIKGGVGPSGSTVAETSVLSPGFPLIILSTLVILIFIHPKCDLMSHYPILFSITVALSYAKISNKLVLAQICRCEIEALDRSWWALFGIFLNQYFGIVVYPLILLWVAFVWITVDLVYYLIKIYHEIGVHLKVGLWSRKRMDKQN